MCSKPKIWKISLRSILGGPLRGGVHGQNLKTHDQFSKSEISGSSFPNYYYRNKPLWNTVCNTPPTISVPTTG